MGIEVEEPPDSCKVVEKQDVGLTVIEREETHLYIFIRGTPVQRQKTRRQTCMVEEEAHDCTGVDREEA